MTELVRTVHCLETLSLNCSVEKFPIDAIRKHGPGLRALWLREYDGLVHRPLRQSRVPTLSLHAFLEILSSCPHITDLALDLDQGMMVRKSFATRTIQSPWYSPKAQSSSFASLLTESRNLRRLRMFVQQPFLSGVDLNNEQDICLNCLNRSCQACEGIEVGATSNFKDRTYEATCTFFQNLILRKQGAAFEKLTMHVAGNYDVFHPEVFSVEGQRQQIGGCAHKRTFVYEPRNVNGHPAISFEKHLVKEPTATSRGILHVS